MIPCVTTNNQFLKFVIIRHPESILIVKKITDFIWISCITLLSLHLNIINHKRAIMAKVDKASMLNGIRGKFGKDMVFRELNGQTIASNISSKKVKPTEKRLLQRAKFKAISPLAKEIIADPVKRARYEAARKPGQ